MEQKNLTVDVGLKEYDINGACLIRFNPTDINWIERLYAIFEQLSERQERWEAATKAQNSARELFKTARELDKEMRELIDGELGQPVCESVFGASNIYALADGLPLWANLLLALLDETETGFAGAEKIGNRRMDAYLKKYKQK